MEMEENGAAPAKTAQNPANRGQNPRAVTTHCVLLCADSPPADLPLLRSNFPFAIMMLLGNNRYDFKISSATDCATGA